MRSTTVFTLKTPSESGGCTEAACILFLLSATHRKPTLPVHHTICSFPKVLKKEKTYKMQEMDSLGVERVILRPVIAQITVLKVQYIGEVLESKSL